MHDVASADLLAHQRAFELDFEPSRPAIFPTIEQALDTLPVDDPVFLLAVHGGPGEDGTLQRMLEERNIPFTGSGSATSSDAFDKERAKNRVKDRVRVAESRVVRNASEVRGAIDDLLSRHEKIVLKPLAGGSSRGLYFLGRGGDIDGIARKVADARIPYILEQFLDGRELTCGVIDHGDGPMALPVVEIEVDTGREFDYSGKYLGQGTREICPANIPTDVAKEAQETALAAHIALDCRGYSRSDLVATRDGVYYLETNTLPGLTGGSLVPLELNTAGIAFRDFLMQQIALAAVPSSA